MTVSTSRISVNLTNTYTIVPKHKIGETSTIVAASAKVELYFQPAKPKFYIKRSAKVVRLAVVDRYAISDRYAIVSRCDN